MKPRQLLTSMAECSGSEFFFWRTNKRFYFIVCHHNGIKKNEVNVHNKILYLQKKNHRQSHEYRAIIDAIK